MLRKICNYLAIIALSLIVTGNSVLANSTVLKDTNEDETVVVDNDKDFNFYKEFLRSGGKRSYTINVEAGKEVQIKIRAASNIALKIQTPDGQVKNSSDEKFFEFNLSNQGEYVVELESLYLTQYSMEILSK